MRSLFPQLSIECCFFSLWGSWMGQNFWLNSNAHPNIRKFLESLKGEQSNTELRKQALHRGESLSKKKKNSKAVSREKRLQKIVSEFQMKTNNGHTCMDYLDGLAHDVPYWLDQILCGAVLSLIGKAVLLCAKLRWSSLIKCSLPQNSWNMFMISKNYCCRKMDGNKIFDVSELFRCYFDLFSMFLFYV